MPHYGDFGNLAKNYTKGRQEFPEETIDFISETSGGLESSSVLDLGCGTGIATRQLSLRGALVTGTDKDIEMIRAAQQEGGAGVRYCVADSSSLPFPDALFDTVTAFSSFHWFTDRTSIDEIRRVLKPGGNFIVTNKNDVGGFKKVTRSIFETHIPGGTPDIKSTYNPKLVLENSGFGSLRTHAVRTQELYSLKKALQYLQSISLWNLIPERNILDVTTELDAFLQKILKKEGELSREIEVLSVAGTRL